jgi:hypothetical protein
MAVLVILAIGTIVLPADTVAAGPGAGMYCRNYCQAHYRDYGGMGSCIRWCQSNYPFAG